jgi:hypothetical protein
MTSNRPQVLFDGEHLALDFLDTTATPRGTRIEWLADGKDLVDWLEQVRSIEPAAAARIRESGSEALDEVSRQAREFRQWLREFVTARKGKPPRATAAAIAPLNELLARDRSFQPVGAAGGDAEGGRRLLLRRVHRWENPGSANRLVRGDHLQAYATIGKQGIERGSAGRSRNSSGYECAAGAFADCSECRAGTACRTDARYDRGGRGGVAGAIRQQSGVTTA